MASLAKGTIVEGGTILAEHVSQFFDSLTGLAAYDNVHVAGLLKITSGSVFIGRGAGAFTTGDTKFHITGSTSLNDTTAVNFLKVQENYFFVSGSGRVGIGTTSPETNLHVTGSISASNLELSGNATIGGNLTIGDQTTDYVVVQADLSSSLIPNNDNSFNIGSTSQAWKNIYLKSNISGSSSTTASFGRSQIAGYQTVGTGQTITAGGQTITAGGQTVTAGGVTVTAGGVTVNGGNVSGSLSSTATFGNYGGNVSGSSTSTGSFGKLEIAGNSTLTGDLTLGGNLTIGDADTDSVAVKADLSSSLIPNNDNAFDIGSASKSWRNIYAKGNVSSSVSSTGSFGRLETYGMLKISASSDTLTETMVLTFHTASGEVFYSSSDAFGGGGLVDIVNDTTPQLGGNLDLNGKDISGSGAVTASGVSIDGKSIGPWSNLADASFMVYSSSLGRWVNATKIDIGLGSSIGHKYRHDQTSTSATWNVSHSLGEQYPNISVYNASNQLVIPTAVTADSDATMTVTFNSPLAGKAYLSTGGSGVLGNSAPVKLNQATAATKWAVTHSLGESSPVVVVYDDKNELMIPQTVKSVDANHTEIFFDSPVSGSALITLGASLPGVNSSNALKFLRVNSDGDGVEYTQPNSITGSLSITGDLTVPQYIYHKGDLDTVIRFQSDSITFIAGDENLIYAVEGSGGEQADKVTINNDSADIDFQVKGDNEPDLIRVDAATDRVGIGVRNPAANLHISGTLQVGSGSSVGHITATGNISSSLTSTGSLASLIVSDKVQGDLTIGGTLYEQSAERFKTDIEPIGSQLNNVMKLNGKKFYKLNNYSKREVGLIAEEVNEVYPEFVSDDVSSVNYGKMVTVLVEAVKELNDNLNQAKERIKILETDK